MTNKSPDRQDFYKNLEELCKINSPKLPYDCILDATISSRWTHAFLELYRCIEYLYGIPESKKLASSIEHLSPAGELLQSLREHIGWKPFEYSAIKSIFSEIDEEIIRDLAESLSLSEECCAEKVSSRLYKLRNSVVHFRTGDQKKQALNVEWQKICISLCKIIKNIYLKYEDDLPQHE